MQQEKFSDLLAGMKPKKLFARRWTHRSAVALVLDSDNIDTANLLLIKRSEREGDPWSGHMAFPGGRKDGIDGNGLATAKREMHEEVGFDVDADESSGDLIGRLSDVRTTRRVIRRTMIISPYVFLVQQRPELIENHEVAESIWLPMSFFKDFDNRSTMSFDYRGSEITMPCYRHGEKVIWGLTLSILDELLGVAGSPPPEWRVV